jgi:hypothetical protein
MATQILDLKISFNGNEKILNNNLTRIEIRIEFEIINIIKAKYSRKTKLSFLFISKIPYARGIINRTVKRLVRKTIS